MQGLDNSTVVGHLPVVFEDSLGRERFASPVGVDVREQAGLLRQQNLRLVTKHNLEKVDRTRRCTAIHDIKNTLGAQRGLPVLAGRYRSIKKWEFIPYVSSAVHRRQR